MSHPIKSVYFGGSRNLPLNTPLPLLAQAVAQAGGCRIHVGCAAGADAQVVQAVGSSLLQWQRLSIFAVGDKRGAGFHNHAAWSKLHPAQLMGASVHWLAGGALHVPMRARLIKRSYAALAGCSLAVFVMSTPAGSKGSLAVARGAVTRGIPVQAFIPGYSYESPPASVGAGQWLPHVFQFSKGITNNMRRCWQWQPAQASLF